MPRHRSYYEGIAVGLTVGFAGALLLPRLFGRRGVPLDTGAAPDTSTATRQNFFSRRDAPESAGDPAHISGAEFSRTGGAPGPGRAGEQLNMPGRPGQLVNSRTDGARLKIADRALKVNPESSAPAKPPARRRGRQAAAPSEASEQTSSPPARPRRRKSPQS